MRYELIKTRNKWINVFRDINKNAQIHFYNKKGMPMYSEEDTHEITDIEQKLLKHKLSNEN